MSTTNGIGQGGEADPARQRPVPLDPQRRASGTGLIWLTRITARGLGRALLRLDVAGRSRVPRSGGVLLAVNHSAFVDGPLVYGLAPRPAVFLVKAEMYGGAVGAVLHRIGQIPVRRGSPESAPLRTALDTLAAGGLVGVFPEGTRGRGEVERVERGIAYLALRSGCPVVPVACHGTAELLPAGRRWPHWRPPVRVVFGEPLVVFGGPRVTRERITRAAEQIRVQLARHVAVTRPESVAGSGAGPGRRDALSRAAEQVCARLARHVAESRLAFRTRAGSVTREAVSRAAEQGRQQPAQHSMATHSASPVRRGAGQAESVDAPGGTP